MPFSKARRWSACFSAGILLLVVLVHAGLMGAGQWEADEYSLMSGDIHGGYLHYLAMRGGWSPRPLSETALYVYGLLVHRLHEPFVGLFLLSCWSFLAACAFYGSGMNIFHGKEKAPSLFCWRLLLALSLLALFLLGHKVGELFYWPMAAVSYLPALAAITFALFMPSWEYHSPTLLLWGKAFAFTVAAASCEMGAMVVLVISLLEVFPGNGTKVQKSLSRPLLKWSAWAIPFLTASGVFAIVMTHRLGMNEIQLPTLPRYQLWGSLRLALGQFLGDVFDPGGYLSTAYDISTENDVLLAMEGISLRLLFFIGFGQCWRLAYPRYRPNRWHLLFAAALTAACYGSIASADYQFGGLCCERHETMRQCFLILAGAALAAYCSPLLAPEKPFHIILIPLVMLFPAVMLLPARIPELVEDYRHYRASVSAREKTWQSGNSQGSAEMKFYLTPAPGVVNGTPYMFQGTYKAHDNAPTTLAPIMRFFGRQRLTVLAPEE